MTQSWPAQPSPAQTNHGAPVGKSGAGMCCMSWRTVMSGLRISALRPATTWGSVVVEAVAEGGK